MPHITISIKKIKIIYKGLPLKMISVKK